MERLWTPWRLPYVTEASAGRPGCIFCDARDRPEGDPLVVHRTTLAFVILNKFPYNSGHLMVVPNRHVSWLSELDSAELAALGDLTQAAERVLMTVYQPHGFNVGLNLGRPAGAGVLHHLHQHVVPRWDGDTNFISVVGQTRVLPEELPETRVRLRAVFTSLARAAGDPVSR